MDDLAGRLQRRDDRLARIGPPVLLAVASVVAAVTAPLLRMVAAEIVASIVLVVLLLAAHQTLVLRRGSLTGPDDPWSRVYLLGRTAGLAVLCVLNPFFSLASFFGYFDAGRYVRPRTGTAVVVVTALTMAGAQSGGLPPTSLVQAGIFAVLVLINVGLGLFFARAGTEQERLTEQRVATIDELGRTNARLAEALAENEDLHAELLVRAREAGRHDERERLALEIHDTIAQSLMAVLTQLEAARAEVAGARTDPGPQRLDRATDLARGALGEARRSVEGLMPAALDGSDLVDALKVSVDGWSRRTGTAADAVVTGTVVPLPAEVDNAVLRVAGEALANVERHAAADRVGVTLSFMHGELALDVRDDGTGILGPAPAGRFGLDGMRRRAERLGGDLVVESGPGCGTAVRLRVPLGRRG